MSQRAPGTRRAQGLVLLAIGVVLMLIFTALSLTEVTTTTARASSVLLVGGVVILATGAILYSLARTVNSPAKSD